MNNKVIIYLLFSFFVLLVSWEEEQAKAVASLHQNVSQEEAIRLRILANSDSIADQMIKRDIRDEVNAAITEWIGDVEHLSEAKTEIAHNIANIEEIVALELEKHGLNQSFTVSLTEAQFPTKLYGNLVYPAGVYDSVLITLGEGKGENWWCVLFPPLCFLEIDNGEAVEQDASITSAESEEDESQEIEVNFFLVELFTSLFDWLLPSSEEN